MLGQRSVVLVCTLTVLVVAPQGTAGGWWSSIKLDRSHVAVRQRVEVRAQLLFSSIAAADEAREEGQYYVYLPSAESLTCGFVFGGSVPA